MSLFSVFNVAGSAMAAQSQRLNVVASNLANADSATSSTGEAYRSRQVVFRTVDISADKAKGVKVAGIVHDPSPMQWCMTRSIRWRTKKATLPCPMSMWWMKWSI